MKNEKELIIEKLSTICDITLIEKEFKLKEEEMVIMFKKALLHASNYTIKTLQREKLINNINFIEEEKEEDSLDFDEIIVLEKEYKDSEKIWNFIVAEEKEEYEDSLFESILSMKEEETSAEKEKWEEILKREGLGVISLMKNYEPI